MDVPNELYTLDSLFSLTGSATAVWMITSVIGYLIEPRDSRALKKWFGLFLALALSFLGTSRVGNPTFLTWGVALVNGFLIYLTAVGANTIVAQSAASTGSVQPPVRGTSIGNKGKKGGFAEAWY